MSRLILPESPILALRRMVPNATRARLLGISSLATLGGAMATAPRPPLASLAKEIDALDPK